MQNCATSLCVPGAVRTSPKPAAAPNASAPPSPAPNAYFSRVVLMVAPAADARSMHAHHAVAETLRLEVAGVATSFAFVRLFADLLATGLLERLAMVSCLAPRRGERRGRQRNERQRQHDRLKRVHVTSPYIKQA